MRILVAVCRVPDASQTVRIGADGTFAHAGVRMVMNPYDEAALEAALRLKEAGRAEEVVAVTVGAPAAQDVLRSALAAGADRAVHVRTEDALSPLFVAAALRDVVQAEGPGLLLLGRQTPDWSSAQTGPMVAALLRWAQITRAVSLSLADTRITAGRRGEAGIEAVEAEFPCVVTADLPLGQLRFANLSAVRAARKKAIGVFPVPDTAPRAGLDRVSAAEPKRRRIRVESAPELVQHLRNERLL